MDVEAVKTLGDQMKRKAGDIERIIQDVQTLVGGASWEGPDAVRFRDDWQNCLSGNLRTVATALEGAGQSAMNNAQEQHDVSQR
jgi:hypothetical protein